MKQTFKVLWTGGYDSTYRIVQLSKHDVIIQPYYVVNKNRKSLSEERKAMKKIEELIHSKSSTKAELLPIIELKREDFPVSESIKRAYKGVYENAKLGPQYEWLSAVSKEVPGLEMCMERSIQKPTEYDLYLRNANYDTIGEGLATCYKLNDNNSPDLVTLLGDFKFPVEVFTRSKQDFLVDFRNWGDEDIVQATWFCSQPINGEPCGYCAPCRNVVKQGMEFRMPASSLKRYHNRKYWLVRYKINKTLKQLTGKWEN